MWKFKERNIELIQKMMKEWHENWHLFPNVPDNPGAKYNNY